MSWTKKFGWSGAIVVFAAVLTLGFLAQQVFAAVSITPSTTTVDRATNTATGTGAYTGMADIVLTGNAVGDFAAGACTFTAPAGWTLQASAPAVISTAAGITGTAAVTAPSTITLTLAGTQTGAGSVTIDLTDGTLDVRPDAATTVDGNVVVATNTCAPSVATGTVAQMLDVVPPTPYTCVLTTTSTSVPASGSEAATVTVTVRDDNGDLVGGVPVSWTVSTGILGTGTSKTATSITSTSGASLGTTTQSYRGAGNVAATDTVIATNSTFNMACTLSMTLTVGGGTTASTITLLSPSTTNVAANVTNTSPNYQSPTQCANFAVQVRDSSGNGVNGQIVLVSTDKGAVAMGFNVTPGFTAKAFTATTATLASSPGGEIRPGIIQGTFCAVQADAAGEATITAQNVSTTMANATLKIMTAGRPNKISATSTGNSIAVTVTDANNNPVADGTPVRFTISSQAGAVSPSCVTTTGGKANAVVALNAATGTVIISTDYNETGAPATCANPGSQQLATSVGVPGGSVGGTATPAPGGTGTIISGSIPRTGGFGLIVFGGGTVQQLVTATGCPVATMAIWATVAGEFVVYVPGTSIGAVNAAFLAAFPGGNIPANTAFIGKCV